MATPDRWAPWIEPQVDAAGSITLTTTGWTTIGSATPASITFTPHIATRLYIRFFMDAECTVFGAPLCRCRLNVNGVGQARQALFKASAVNGRIAATNSQVLDLAKETTYTILLEAELSAAGATYLVRGGGFEIVAMYSRT